MFTGATSLTSTSIEIDFAIIATETTMRVPFLAFVKMPTIPNRAFLNNPHSLAGIQVWIWV
jgi:hypothetical protein